jgi:predicted ABC-type ATPase
MKPRLVVLAGPNGAGKSTFYRLYLKKSGLPFLNADVLQVNTGIDVYEAARTVDAARLAYLEVNAGFITETVFSDPDGRKLEFLRKAIAAGYDVQLIYIGLANPELAQMRVAQRVADGGHAVPAGKVASRYPRSLENLAKALKFVPTVLLFDNSAHAEYHRLGIFKDGRLMEKTKDGIPRWAQRFFSSQPVKRKMSPRANHNE